MGPVRENNSTEYYDHLYESFYHAMPEHRTNHLLNHAENRSNSFQVVVARQSDVGSQGARFYKWLYATPNSTALQWESITGQTLSVTPEAVRKCDTSLQVRNTLMIIAAVCALLGALILVGVLPMGTLVAPICLLAGAEILALIAIVFHKRFKNMVQESIKVVPPAIPAPQWPIVQARPIVQASPIQYGPTYAIMPEAFVS